MRRQSYLKLFIVVLFTFLFVFKGVVFAENGKLTFWTTAIEPKRMTIQKGLSDRFAKNTGIKVEIIPVKESDLPTRIVAAAAAGSLPDTVFVPLDYVITWVEEGLLDPKPATAIIKNLGDVSFATGPLRFVRLKSGWAAVPADGWGQLLLYRKDLFVGRDAANMLGAPNTWDKILKAAKALHDPPKRWGIAVGTDPTQTYTQQVFEQFALSNGARLINPTTRKVDLITPEFVQTLMFYKELTKYAPKGDIYWRQTREDYLGGRVAMIIWSPFIFDEMAGLRDSVPVTAKGLKKKLHEYTGLVTAFQGPLGIRPAQWGQVNYFGITVGADDSAAKWVEFLLEDGYLDWLNMAPEGKFPLRRQFAKGWKDLKIGVDRKARISDLYSDDVIASITAGVERFDRWGFGMGKGACVGQVYGTKTVSRILRRYLDGEMSTEAAAEAMTKAIRKLDGCS